MAAAWQHKELTDPTQALTGAMVGSRQQATLLMPVALSRVLTEHMAEGARATARIDSGHGLADARALSSKFMHVWHLPSQQKDVLFWFGIGRFVVRFVVCPLCQMAYELARVNAHDVDV